jgi:hypothetical protein
MTTLESQDWRVSVGPQNQQSTPEEGAPRRRSRWLTRRALLAHLAIIIWFPGCLIAGRWQVSVALSGDHLAYLYSVEWPVFALFGLVAWWHLIHDDPETIGAKGLLRLRAQHPESASATAAPTRRREEEDEQLAAYNDFLEGLAAKDAPKTWRRR